MKGLISDLFGAANGYGYDPLILDLDGDGIETTGLSSGTYFDHNNDGFARVDGVGWF